ncbi:MAG: N-acetylneuraminate lyase [Gammaproteobacteria bacterium]|nr:N-acetylneuraminate lyase [Gammaproteobacteria bacterium]
MPLNSGSYAALLTPYSNSRETINEDALEALVNHNIDQKVDGLYVGGSTAETFLQAFEKRVTILQTVARSANGRIPLIAQVGDLNPRVSNRLARVAADAGYDAISAIPPFYYQYEWHELKDFYRKLAGLTGLPFLIYSIPSLTGVSFSTQQMTELLNLPNVVGLKNTASDYFAMEELVRANPTKLIFDGYDQAVLAGLAMGAYGAIGSTQNVQGYKFRALFDAFATNDMPAALAMQREINELIVVIIEHGVFRSLKYLLDLEGIPMGDCREPFHPLTEVGKTALAIMHERLLSR